MGANQCADGKSSKATTPGPPRPSARSASPRRGAPPTGPRASFAWRRRRSSLSRPPLRRDPPRPRLASSPLGACATRAPSYHEASAAAASPRAAPAALARGSAYRVGPGRSVEHDGVGSSPREPRNGIAMSSVGDGARWARPALGSSGAPAIRSTQGDGTRNGDPPGPPFRRSSEGRLSPSPSSPRPSSPARRRRDRPPGSSRRPARSAPPCPC